MIVQTPIKPMNPIEKLNLKAALGTCSPASQDWISNLAVLWLHVCHDKGIKPADARAKDSIAFHRIKPVWAETASKLVNSDPYSFGTAWAPTVAKLAFDLHEKTRKDRAAVAGGVAQGLLL